MNHSRQLSPLDRLLVSVDQGLRTLAGQHRGSGRPVPAPPEDAELTGADRTEAGRLMRINHTGEVCAQALYQGQALTAKLNEVEAQMKAAAEEESDHLRWCETRLRELGARTSILNPLFYAGAFSIGALAGAAGDKWSLGFVAETEKQVMAHLDGHLRRLDAKDTRTRAIVQQMHDDEAQHAQTALDAGGRELPLPIRMAMRLSAKVMTRSTYWI